VRSFAVHGAREVIRDIADAETEGRKSGGRLSGASGLVAGARLAAMIPLAKKAIAAVRAGALPTTEETVFGAATARAGDRTGKGRGMPVHQAVDVPVPIETAYN
jgi:hypothetical protein